MLGRLFDRWAERRQAAELQSMLAILAGLSRHELAELAIVANHARQVMEAGGDQLQAPLLAVAARPDLALRLVRMVENFRAKGNQTGAAAFMVWAHTVRAALRPGLRPLAQQMWRELGRGFDAIPEVAPSLSARLATAFDLEGATDYPAGFDPRF